MLKNNLNNNNSKQRNNMKNLEVEKEDTDIFTPIERILNFITLMQEAAYHIEQEYGIREDIFSNNLYELKRLVKELLK